MSLHVFRWPPLPYPSPPRPSVSLRQPRSQGGSGSCRRSSRTRHRQLSFRPVRVGLRSPFSPRPPLLRRRPGPDHQTDDRRHPRLSRPDSCPSHPYRPTRIHQRFWFRLLAQNRQFFICGRTIRAQTSRSARSGSRFTVRKMIRFSLSPNLSEINTYRCVSKQTTLTIFRMNTFAKQGGGVSLSSTPCRYPIYCPRPL